MVDGTHSWRLPLPLPWGLSRGDATCQCGRLSSVPGREDPLEKGMATHSSVLAWRIPWTEESGGLKSTGSQRAAYNFPTKNNSLPHRLRLQLRFSQTIPNQLDRQSTRLCPLRQGKFL